MGPLLVDEYDTTVVVRPGWTARRDEGTGALVLEREAERVSTRPATDPVTLQIVANALQSITDEMATTITAPRTRPSSATAWTSRVRSATPAARRSRRR